MFHQSNQQDQRHFLLRSLGVSLESTNTKGSEMLTTRQIIAMLNKLQVVTVDWWHINGFQFSGVNSLKKITKVGSSFLQVSGSLETTGFQSCY